MSVNWTLYFFLVHLLLWAMRLVHFLFFWFFCIKSVICWPPSGSYSDNMIFVLMFLECPKLLIESYWYHFTFYSILYLYPSLGHYYSCSQVLVLHFCWQLPNLFFSIYWPSAGSPFAVWFSLTFRFGMDVIKLSQVECRQEWIVARRALSVLTFYLYFLFTIDFDRCMQSLTCFTVWSVSNMNIPLLLFHQGSLNSN